MYAGAALSEDCLETYKQMPNRIKESINDHGGLTKEFHCFDLAGFTITSEQFKIGFEKSLQCAQQSTTTDAQGRAHVPVLFILTIKDPSEMRAFRLNEERFSAYPDEFEVVLQAGSVCYVLRTEEIIYEDQIVHVVHLFSYG